MADNFDATTHWDALRERMEKGGPREVARYVLEFQPDERKALFSFAQKSFARKEWLGKSFDGLIDVVQAGMDDALTLANQSTDPEKAWKWTEHANILAFNLSADLCESWPGDEAPRERHHLETGLRMAEKCVRWRRELGKPPERRALAYWALGMHQLSLGHPHEALGAWVTASGLAVADREAAGLPHRVEAGSDFAVILYAGYVGLARIAVGDAAGREAYEAACRAFEETIARFPDKKDDAQFGLDQLRHVERKFAGTGPGAPISSTRP